MFYPNPYRLTTYSLKDLIMTDVCIKCGEKMAWWRAVEESDTEGVCVRCDYRRERADNPYWFSRVGFWG